MDDLLLDACVAINLVASGLDLVEVAEASSVRFVMTSTAAAEALWLAPRETGGEREAIDIGGLVNAGALALLDLKEDELELFVAFAQEVDDGEAATFAVATKRAVGVATDDRRAQRLAADLNPPIPIVGTTRLLRAWVDAHAAPPDRVLEMIRSVESRASYIPRRDDPQFEWWAANGDT